MWVFTETGFVSAVQSSKNSETLSVRARDKVSLVSIAEATGQPILRSPEGDYPYRVFVERVAFAQWMFEQAMNLDYSNYKNRVFDSRGYEYAHDLGRVWSVMLDTGCGFARGQHRRRGCFRRSRRPKDVGAHRYGRTVGGTYVDGH